MRKLERPVGGRHIAALDDIAKVRNGLIASIAVLPSQRAESGRSLRFGWLMASAHSLAARSS